MQIPILVEPTPAGFRARSGAPFDLSVEKPTRDEAVAELESTIQDRLRSGAELTSLAVGAGPPLLPWPDLSQNPLFEAWQEEIRKYRQMRDAETDES